MNQAGRAAKKISPITGVAAAAGLTVGAAGVWAWRKKSPTALPERWAKPVLGVGFFRGRLCGAESCQGFGGQVDDKVKGQCTADCSDRAT